MTGLNTLGRLIAATLALSVAHPVLANNYGESLAWQFRTSADKVNQAALRDLVQKQRGGYYSAPIYNTSIARQYNCSIAPVATGNQGYQAATANSPSVTGATAQASGNSNTAATTGGHAGAVDSQQANAGAVSSGVVDRPTPRCAGPHRRRSTPRRAIAVRNRRASRRAAPARSGRSTDGRKGQVRRSKLRTATTKPVRPVGVVSVELGTRPVAAWP